MIKISKYDREVDAIYIQIKEDQVLDSEEIAEGIIVDYNAQNEVVGFELLDIDHIEVKSFKTLINMLSKDTIAMLQEFDIFTKVMCRIR